MFTITVATKTATTRRLMVCRQAVLHNTRTTHEVPTDKTRASVDLPTSALVGLEDHRCLHHHHRGHTHRHARMGDWNQKEWKRTMVMEMVVQQGSHLPHLELVSKEALWPPLFGRKPFPHSFLEIAATTALLTPAATVIKW
jgi:hypothetical protein